MRQETKPNARRDNIEWEEYAPAKTTREKLYEIRMLRNRTKEQVAADISEETGYTFTQDQYRAIEQGITKNIPLWVIMAFARVYYVTPDEMFPGLAI